MASLISKSLNHITRSLLLNNRTLAQSNQFFKCLSNDSTNNQNPEDIYEQNEQEQTYRNVVQRNFESNSGKNSLKDLIGAGFFGKALFPTSDTHTKLAIEGKSFNQLQIIHIKSSKNNTILTLTEPTGTVLFTTSAGSNGFKNAKKSTTTAAQAAAVTMSEFMKRRGLNNIRLVLKGLGNGRLASVKTLQMNGINIVSITDTTIIPIPYMRPLRPPVQRRV